MAQPWRTLLAVRKNQTRALKRKSTVVSAPTGPTCSGMKVWGPASARAGATKISFRLPRSRMSSTGSCATSSMKRTQRVHMTQRSAS